ncbi:MAG: hypothetical protein OEW18_00375 [Candidatus Aminicenantes bacterium]|nr:hypothetical protein [Candidatus Aminicenantes bacterium]
MRKVAGISAACLLICACAQEPRILDYRLTETLRGRDFDYAWINEIDSVPPPYPADGQYQIGDLKTVDGPFTVYKFIREYEPESRSAESPAKFHDLLLVKTDNQGNILDAYHYTLEWSDSPSLDLERMGATGLNLRRRLTVADFGFEPSCH